MCESDPVLGLMNNVIVLLLPVTRFHNAMKRQVKQVGKKKNTECRLDKSTALNTLK